MGTCLLVIFSDVFVFFIGSLVLIVKLYGSIWLRDFVKIVFEVGSFILFIL